MALDSSRIYPRPSEMEQVPSFESGRERHEESSALVPEVPSSLVSLYIMAIMEGL